MASKHTNLTFKDIYAVNVFLNEQLEDWCYQKSREAYTSLAKVLLAKIIVFNRIKAGEASRITVFDLAFSDKVQDAKLPDSITQNVDKLTLSLENQRYKLFFTPKKGDVAFMLLSDLMVKRMRDLRQLRKELNLTKYHYLFSDPNTPETPLSSRSALYEAAQGAKLSMSYKLTAYALRAHYAEFTQDFSLYSKSASAISDYDSESYED